MNKRIRPFTLNYLLLISTALLINCTSLDNPKPEFKPFKNEGYFIQAEDGTSLFIFHYKVNKSRGTVFLLSGITGINHRNEKDLILALSANQLDIVVIHPRGTGFSEGSRGNLKDFSSIIRDYIWIINQDQSSKNKFIYGHSMSTAMAIAVAKELKDVNALLLINPPVILKASEGMSPGFFDYIKYAIYMIFNPHAPIVNMAGNPEHIENPIERTEAELRNKDPLLVKYFSMYMMMESKKLMDSMADMALKCNFPLLLIYGSDDSIVDKKGCDLLMKNWLCDDKHYVEIAHGPHGKKTILSAIKKDIVHQWISKYF